MTQPIRPFLRGDSLLERGLSRRVFLERALRAGTLGAAALWTPGVLAEELVATPSSRALEGPFYPDTMPLDTDNDLLIVNDSITPAVGEVTHLYGTVTTRAGTPLRNAFVEIWQCDTNQSYRHEDGVNEDVPPDSNFQGYGRFLTNVKGEYYFRTIKPVPYIIGDVFRTPHIHFAVSRNGERIGVDHAITGADVRHGRGPGRGAGVGRGECRRAAGAGAAGAGAAGAGVGGR